MLTLFIFVWSRKTFPCSTCYVIPHSDRYRRCSVDTSFGVVKNVMKNGCMHNTTYLYAQYSKSDRIMYGHICRQGCMNKEIDQNGGVAFEMETSSQIQSTFTPLLHLLSLQTDCNSSPLQLFQGGSLTRRHLLSNSDSSTDSINIDFFAALLVTPTKTAGLPCHSFSRQGPWHARIAADSCFENQFSITITIHFKELSISFFLFAILGRDHVTSS